jgi:hypothetical protein
MKFKYTDFRGKFLPLVPIELKGKEWVKFMGYLDSGASYSVFHSDVLRILDLDITEGRRQFITVGDGSLIAVYFHRVPVRFSETHFEADIGFSKQLGIGFDIIGRRDIFERFVICFDEKNKLVEIK